MLNASIVGLINNVALLLVAGLAFEMMGDYSLLRKPSLRQIFTGVVLGVIGWAVMLTPWELMPGLIFDTCSILLGLSGLFFGTLPAFIAVVFTSALRIFIGGTGVVPGVGVIVTSAAIGLAWRHWRKPALHRISVRELYLLGLIVHLNMLMWMLLLPFPTSFEVISQLGLPVMIIYPVGTALLGWVFVGRIARIHTEEALLHSERQLRVITDNLPAYVSLLGADDLRYRFVNSRFIDLFKLPKDEVVGKHIKDVVGEETYALVLPHLERALAGELVSYENLVRVGGDQHWMNVTYVPDVDEQGKAATVIVLGHDVTARRSAEEALRENERLLRTIAENYPNSYLSVIEKDFSVGFTAGREFTNQGLDPDAFVGLKVDEVFGERADFVREYYQKTFAGEEETFELFINNQYQKYSTIPFYDDEGTVVRILSVVENITKRKEAEIEIRKANERLRTQLDEIKALQGALREQAMRDPLTGLFNRRYMQEALQQAVGRAKRRGEALSLVMLDLDYLKEINERYGHVAGGDKALLALTAKIQSLCRAEDTFCRYAGDEFVVIFCNTSLPVAYQRVQDWQEALSKIKIDDTFGVSFSAGIAELSVDAISGDELINRADEALFQAKAQGRNRVVAFGLDAQEEED